MNAHLILVLDLFQELKFPMLAFLVNLTVSNKDCFSVGSSLKELEAPGS